MGFSRQEYWSVLPFSSPGDLPDPGIEPASTESPAAEPPEKPILSFSCFNQLINPVALMFCRKKAAKELMLLNYGAGEDLENPLDSKNKPVNPKGNQP